jgi:glycine/D-amino acid oxidase-like deaminating enzyme
MARRLMPIPSTIIATEKLGTNRVSSLFPQGNMIVETRSYHSYFRPDPWGERILYGGRASLVEMDEQDSARRLRDYMLSVFPELVDVKLTHSWNGFVAFTFDGAPHLGQVGGIWHACGYNGSGVAMAPYLGWRLAQKIMRTDQGTTALWRQPVVPAHRRAVLPPEGPDRRGAGAAAAMMTMDVSITSVCPRLSMRGGCGYTLRERGDFH